MSKIQANKIVLAYWSNNRWTDDVASAMSMLGIKERTFDRLVRETANVTFKRKEPLLPS